MYCIGNSLISKIEPFDKYIWNFSHWFLIFFLQQVIVEFLLKIGNSLDGSVSQHDQKQSI